jgi:hypothetical protein
VAREKKCPSPRHPPALLRKPKLPLRPRRRATGTVAAPRGRRPLRRFRYRIQLAQSRQLSGRIRRLSCGGGKNDPQPFHPIPHRNISPNPAHPRIMVCFFRRKNTNNHYLKTLRRLTKFMEYIKNSSFTTRVPPSRQLPLGATIFKSEPLRSRQMS